MTHRSWLLGLFLFTQTAIAQQKAETIWYTKPAEHWLEALPIGNGSVGAMIFGGINSDRIQFNESSLITGDDKYVGFYQPFGNIYVTSDHKNSSEYKRSLTFSNALQTVEYVADQIQYKREYFVSNPDGVMVMMFTANRPKSISTTVFLKDARATRSIVHKNHIQFKGSLPENKLSYYAALNVKAIGGKYLPTDSSIQVVNADTLVLFMTAGTNLKMVPDHDFLGEDPARKVEETLTRVYNFTYAQLKQRHVQDFNRLYSRVHLDLGPTPDLPSNERLALYNKGAKDPALEALLYQYGRYLLISSSRKGGYPANLQGIWNDEFKPAWYSQYTTNINVEMNYWLAEQTNIPECHLPLFDWVENLANKNRGTKDSILAVEKGWVAFSTNNILGSSSRWRLHRPGSAWLSQHFWDHYQFTGDKHFLNKRAYPLLKEIVEYWESHLVEGPGGKLITPDGWSPEHGPGKNEQDKNPYPGTSYDQQIIYDLFSNYIDAERIVRKDPAYLDRAIELRKRLLGPQIGKWGQLQEWMEDVDDSTDRHRHNSHLFAVHPGRQISPIIDVKMSNAASKALDFRGNISTGWSAAWRMNIRARLLEPEKAYALVKVLLRPASIDMKYHEGSGVYPNFFDAHPPFQMDGNFGYTAGITEMLLQSHLGVIHVLPALPSAWPSGSITGLKARGNVEVNIHWNNGSLNTLTLKPTFTGDYQIRYQAKTIKLHLLANHRYTFNSALEKK